MEAHRADAACAGCHKVMDPMGFSLENFDAVGQWRNTDDGTTIDPSGTLFNGAKVDGPVALRNMLNSKPEIFTGVLTEKLMTYALGRGVEYSGHARGTARFCGMPRATTTVFRRSCSES